MNDSVEVKFNYIKSSNNEKYELISECPNFYYVDNSKKYCIDSCKDVGKFFINGQKECIGSCPTTPVTINGNLTNEDEMNVK